MMLSERRFQSGKGACCLLLFALFLPACVSVQIAETTPSIETLKLLRNANIPPLAIGEFKAGGAVGRAKSINIRGSTINAPKDGTFADFLKQTVQAELSAAGKYDPASATSLSAVLDESRGSENIATGRAALGAEFQVSKSGRLIFAKRYRVESDWKSDFIGALAIPEAFRQYNALYADLVRAVFTDPEFIAATKT